MMHRTEVIRLSDYSPMAQQNWRTQIKLTHLIPQISSILLQRHNWPSLLQTLNLKSKLTPSFFLRILTTIKTQPQISLDFFKWAINNTSFQPDLSVQCRMVHLLIASGLVNPSKPILDSLLHNHPPAHIVPSLFKLCEKDAIFPGSKSSLVFHYVLGWYCEKGLCYQALEVFSLANTRTEYSNGSALFSIGSYNTVLNALQEKNEIKMGFSFFAGMIRHGVLIDQFTWRIVAKIFSKQGKIDAILRIIKMGMHDSFIYDLLIECCSETGEFEVALHVFDEMSKRKLNPGFNTFASLLNGACRYENNKVIKFAMESMAEKGYISEPLKEHDSIIHKLCDMRKPCAANMVFKRASDMLENETYGRMLQALSMEARIKDAIETHHVIVHRRVEVNPIFYGEFINLLCNQDPSAEVNKLLIDMISRGLKPSPLASSRYITSLCKKRRWNEAEDLADLALGESISLEASCCGCLVKQYCKRGNFDLAMHMHGELKKKELTLDSRSYSVLLSGLMGKMRVQEAEGIFDYMRTKKLVSSESFVIMITGFCGKNELKRAMQLHNEMLAMGHKPSTKMYKRLISNFR